MRISKDQIQIHYCINDITSHPYKPAHCDPEGSKQHGFQLPVVKPEDPHKHAKVQNLELSSLLQK